MEWVEQEQKASQEKIRPVEEIEVIIRELIQGLNCYDPQIPNLLRIRHHAQKGFPPRESHVDSFSCRTVFYHRQLRCNFMTIPLAPTSTRSESQAPQPLSMRAADRSGFRRRSTVQPGLLHHEVIGSI